MSTIESMYEEEMAQDAAERFAPAMMVELSLCSIRMGDEVFGIDTSKVREVLGRTDRGSRRGVDAGPQARHDLRRVPLAPAYVAGVIPYRGEVLTTLSLRALLGGGQGMPGGCVLVMDDEETGELLGLMVDAVSGVVTVKASMLEPNPSTLHARSKALFDGVYRMPSGLVVRIDPRRLSPSRLKATGLFGEEGGKSPMRALIVDDSKFIREHLQGMLERMNMQCEHAGDGQEALDVLGQGSAFDVMFCDVLMPVMDGLACVKAVRESGLCDGMRVMMVTTEMDHELIERALECGADEFLMKPFTEEGLRDKLLLLGMSIV